MTVFLTVFSLHNVQERRGRSDGRSVTVHLTVHLTVLFFLAPPPALGPSPQPPAPFRRPPGPAWVRRWRYRFMNTVLEEHDGKRQEEQGGWAYPSYQPPPLLGPPFAAGNSKGGWAYPSYQPPPPPGPLLRYLSSGMGRPGAGGRTCEMALWCRRGRIF